MLNEGRVEMILENITRLCKKNGISIARLERETKISNGTISRWGTSSPTIHNAKAVADYFGVTVDDLLMEETGGLLETDAGAIERGIRSGGFEPSTQEESCIHVLRGLISYHERMTMGNCPERDFYLDALRYALKCVEEKNGK